MQNAIAQEGYRTFAKEGLRDQSGKPLAWWFDLRRVLLQPKYHVYYRELFWAHASAWGEFQLCGPLSSGAVLAGMLAAGALPPRNCFYVRKELKNTGPAQLIEGTPNQRPVVIVDDTINSGRSLMRCVNTVQQAGLTVRAVLIVVRIKHHAAYAWLDAAGISLVSLFAREQFDLSPAGVAVPADPPSQ